MKLVALKKIKRSGSYILPGTEIEVGLAEAESLLKNGHCAKPKTMEALTVQKQMGVKPEVKTTKEETPEKEEEKGKPPEK